MRPKASDICLSLRSFWPGVKPGEPGSAEYAWRLLDEVRPTRIEWSYLRDREAIARCHQVAPVFVAALNTIMPAGHAETFDSLPVIAPWMTSFGTPDARKTYICQNNPDDLRSRIEQATELIRDGITDTFQFDDWYGNAQMFDFGQPCFCPHCQREFQDYLGLPLDYRRYLRGRGFTCQAELLATAKEGRVPLWDDYRRFQQQTVTRYFHRLRGALDQALARPATLSVNGSVLGFGGDIQTVLPLVQYFHGETGDFGPATLVKLAEASRRLERPQVISFFPHVPEDQYDAPAFVARVSQGIALCYCLGLLPLFPYDVYAGNDASGRLKRRWYGTWQQYRAPYEVVRAHPEWFDGYAYETVEIAAAAVTVICRHRQEPARRLRHQARADGSWETAVS